MASRLAPAQPRGVTWNGAGAWLIVSQSRQVNFSRTVWITFHCRGITLAEPVRATAAADLGRRHDHALARQMLREGLARRPPAREGLDPRGLGGRLLGGQLILGRVRLQLLELQLQLVEQARLALRALAVELAPQPLDHELQRGDDRLGVRGLGFRPPRPRLGRRKGGAQGVDIGRGGALHDAQ
jgi:hypothetical protein